MSINDKEFETWVSVKIGSLTVESGFTYNYYSSDVLRDYWIQTIRGLMETLDGAVERGLVMIEASEEETED